MTLRFFFEKSTHLIFGIDENGYGPILGPLVVTGVGFTIEGDYLSKVKIKIFPGDSKVIFQPTPKGYETLEKYALKILNSLELKPQTFFELLSMTGNEIDEEIYKDFQLPAWADKISDEKIPNILTFAQKILSVEEFNFMVEKGFNKSFINFSCFVDIVNRLLRKIEEKQLSYTPPVIFYLGKIGGTKKYLPWLDNFFQKAKIEIIRESKIVSTYLIDNKIQLNFWLDADERFFPVSLASILGKYTRELTLLSLTKKFLEPHCKYPLASGYRHDKKTHSFITFIQTKFTNIKKVIRHI